MIACEISGRGGSDVRDGAHRTILATPVPAPCVIDAVERQLGQAYLPIDTIAASLGTATASVIDALAVLERQHGVGQFIDVTSRENCSVRLRTPGCHTP
jgi:hypothetical protein